MNQLTLKAPFTVEGKGLHSGLMLKATFLPAPENTGYKFKRVDLPDQPVIDAVAENVVETTRGTVIGRKDVTVSTIEHAMAALYAAGVDNVMIGGERPRGAHSGRQRHDLRQRDRACRPGGAESR